MNALLIIPLMMINPKASAAPTRCARALAGVMFAGALFAPAAHAAADDAPEVPVPAQDQRTEALSGYVAYPDFPHLEVVKDSEGTPTALAALITDPVVKARIDAHGFFVLDVRNLAVSPRTTFVDGATLTIPYVASVKQTKRSNRWLNPNQGTGDVGGFLMVEERGGQLRVSVLRLRDSYWTESLGRALGFNRHFNLPAARAIAKPQLEHWFNADPARIQTLLKLVGR